MITQLTARNLMVLMVDETDHVTGLAGLTLTITASKDGAAFASISPTVTDRGSGWYSVALTSSHTDTLGDLVLHVTATGADPADVREEVVVAPATATQATAIETDTQDIQARLPATLVGGRIDASVGAMEANTLTASAIAADAVAEVQSGLATGAALADLQSDVDTAVSGIAATLAAVGTVDTVVDGIALAVANVDSDLSAVGANVLTRAAPGDAMTLTSGERDDVAEALLDLAAAVRGATVRQVLQRMAAAMIGKSSGFAAGAGTRTLRSIDDTVDELVVVQDANANRTDVTAAP